MGLLGKTSSYRGSGVEKQPFRGEAPAPLGDMLAEMTPVLVGRFVKIENPR